MKLMNRLMILLVLMLLTAFYASAQPIAFTNVTVIDVAEGAAVPGRTVIVSGEHITAVGAPGAVTIPSVATVIDGSEKYLIPGLWDMHVHTTTDRNTRKIIFPLLVTHGVTGIRSMATDSLGSIEPGKLADLILIDGDPTINISEIRRVVTVIKDGRVYDPAAIYRALGIEPCCEE